MLKRRFVLYIIVCFIVALIPISYVGYKAYQKHVEFNAFMSNALVLNRSIEEPVDHSSHDHAHEKVDSPSVVEVPNGEYVYDINGMPVFSKEILGQDVLDKAAWMLHGTMSASVEQQIKNLPDLSGYVAQRVVTPDGQVRSVLVPEEHQYKEGDAIHESEIMPVPAFIEAKLIEPPKKVIIWQDVEYPYPDEYYKIEDRFERELYIEKFGESLERSIPMEEVDKKIAAGEISLSELSKYARQSIEHEDKLLERANMLSPTPTGVSDTPPVKVRFLNDGPPQAGWERKLKSKHHSDSEESLPLDTETASFGSNVPRSPSSLSGKVESPPAQKSVKDIEKQLTPAGIETELSGELSTDPFDKAQQLIDQYGTAEGLRRLKEMDPEAARRFEQERRGAPSRDVPKGHTHPDGQSHDDSR